LRCHVGGIEFFCAVGTGAEDLTKCVNTCFLLAIRQF